MMSLSAQHCGHDQHPSFLTRDTTFPSKVSILILVYSVFPVSERNWFSHHTALGGERGAGHSTSDVEAGEGGTSHLPSAVEAGERGTGCAVRCLFLRLRRRTANGWYLLLRLRRRRWNGRLLFRRLGRCGGRTNFSQRPGTRNIPG